VKLNLCNLDELMCCYRCFIVLLLC